MMNIGLTVLTIPYIYVNVKYDRWLKCMLRGNVFPPTLGEQCG